MRPADGGGSVRQRHGPQAGGLQLPLGGAAPEGRAARLHLRRLLPDVLRAEGLVPAAWLLLHAHLLTQLDLGAPRFSRWLSGLPAARTAAVGSPLRLSGMPAACTAAVGSPRFFPDRRFYAGERLRGHLLAASSFAVLRGVVGRVLVVNARSLLAAVAQRFFLRLPSGGAAQ